MIGQEWKPWYSYAYLIAIILAVINVGLMITEMVLYATHRDTKPENQQVAAKVVDGQRVTKPLWLISKYGNDFTVSDESRVVTILHFCDDSHTPSLQDQTQVEFTYTVGKQHELLKEEDQPCLNFVSLRVIHAPYDDPQPTEDTSKTTSNDCDNQSIKSKECQEESK